MSDLLIEYAREALLGGTRPTLTERAAMSPEERSAFTTAGLQLAVQFLTILRGDQEQWDELLKELDPEAFEEGEDIRMTTDLLDQYEKILG